MPEVRPPLSTESRQAVGDRLVAQLIDNIAIPAFVLNREHVITHWNQALAHATGLSRERMVGTRDQWRPFYGEPRPTMADLIIDGEVDRQVEQYYRDKYQPSELLEGAFVAEDFFPEVGEGGEWLSFTASPLRDDGGEVVGAIETLLIITDRKKAEMELRAREQRYRELSILDDLTGLFNSRHFYREIARELERHRRYHHPLSLCMFDLDRFKSLNDTHGHLFGDRVLAALGRLIRSHLRSTDTGFRHGGEEFLVLMPQVDERAALRAAERIRQGLEALVFHDPQGGEVRVTLSGGVAAVGPGDTDRSLLGRVDQLLYAAKAAGRNRVLRALDEAGDDAVQAG